MKLKKIRLRNIKLKNIKLKNIKLRKINFEKLSKFAAFAAVVFSNLSTCSNCMSEVLKALSNLNLEEGNPEETLEENQEQGQSSQFK